MNAILELDRKLFVLLNQEWVSSFLDIVMPFVTDFDHWRLPLVIVLLFALARGRAEVRVGILFAILAVAVADQVSSSGIKPLFERTRPFHVIEGVRKLVDAHDHSFPSSHAANTFAAGVFLAIRFARMRWLLVVPLVVAYSRVYVGVHYPLDVVGGAALGSLIGVGFVAVERMSRIRLEKWLSFGRRRNELPPARAGGDADTASPPDEVGPRDASGQKPGDPAD